MLSICTTFFDINPYQPNVESDSTALYVVPGPTSSKNPQDILRCLLFDFPEIMLSSGCFWTSRLHILWKISLEKTVGIHMNNFICTGLKTLRFAHIELECAGYDFQIKYRFSPYTGSTGWYLQAVRDIGIQYLYIGRDFLLDGLASTQSSSWRSASLRHTPHVGEVKQSMTGARQKIAVLIAFRKYTKISLDRRAGAYQSSRRKNTLYYLN